MNQREIAEKLKISQATVSLALKNSTKISPELRESVRNLAVATGYQPNLAGQMLRQGRSNAVGVLFPSFTNLFYSELFQELQRQLMADGYLLCLTRADSNADLAEAVEKLRAMKVCAVIALGQMAGPLFELLRAEIPLIIYGGDEKLEIPVSQVLPDRFRGGFELTTFLIERRHRRRIAFVGCSNPAELRFRGYLAALAGSGLEFRPELVIAPSAQAADGYLMMIQLLAAHPEVDAVFCHNDETALGAMRAALELRRRIPEDLTVVGFDNISIGRFLTPSLTTVEQPRAAIAEALAASLRTAVAEPGKHQFHSIPCRLIERES
ncbi:MAG: LacI family DNA-binding transcriptional regulator [Victivallaceae bacterium]